MSEQKEPLPAYGYCPKCGAEGLTRERRPNRDDTCVKGHTYPSSQARYTPVAQPDKAEVVDYLAGLQHDGKIECISINCEQMAEAIAALPPQRDDSGLVVAVAGWRLYSADFSREGAKGSVTLIRDAAGHQWWLSLSDEEKDEESLFETGFGATFREALLDANAKAAQAKEGV